MDRLISVIVPSYNSEKTIERCIKSLINQSYQYWEMIVVDDGSTDESASIIRKFANLDSRIKYYYQDNAGVSTARNTALSKSNGYYTAFLDADDWYDYDFLEKLKNEIEMGDYDIACSAFKISNEEGYRSILGKRNETLYGLSVLDSFFFCNSIQGFMCNKLFVSSVLSNIQFNPEIRICEDLIFLCEIYKLKSKSIKMTYINEPLYNYWIVGEGATSSKKVMVDNNGGSQLYKSYKIIEALMEEKKSKRLVNRFIGERMIDCFYKEQFNKTEIRKQARTIMIPFLCSNAKIKRKIKFILGLIFNKELKI